MCTSGTVVRCEPPHELCVRRDGCDDQMDRVGQTRFVESCGSRDDSVWNLSLAKQDETIRDDMGPQGRGQERKSPEAGASRCSKVEPFGGMLS